MYVDRRFWLVLALWAPTVALGGAQLLLIDGQVLDGTTVERKESLYLLTLDTGNVFPIPVELVRQVRLTGEDAPVPTGVDPADEGKALAGPEAPVPLPRTHDQLEAFGRDPASFRRNVIDPTWRPTSDWSNDPSLNEFNPARWYQSPIDATWTPQSAFSKDDDVTEFNPARWYQSPIDPTWRPQDGFRRDER